MALLPSDSIKVVAESLGVGALSEDVAASLAPDAEYRLREIAQEALKFMRHCKREILTTEDISSALRLRNIEGLYGFNASSDPLSFVRVAGTADLYYIDDKEVELNEVINAPLPSCPLDVNFSVHWLAVEGVQPIIPQNPPLETIAKRRKPTAVEKISEIKPIVKHVLSKELQLYFEKVTDAIKGKEKELRLGAIRSVASDPGIQSLVPYFTQWIADEITQNLRNLPLLQALMELVRALVESPHLHVEPYLHQLMPSILTCVVGKRLCEDPKEDHWKLRGASANLVAHICKTWGETYTTLQPRVTKTLIHAFLDPSKGLTTHYGGLRGLTALGPDVVKLLVIPNIPPYLRALLPDLQSTDEQKQKEAQKIREQLLEAVVVYLQAAGTKPKDDVPVAAGSGSEEQMRASLAATLCKMTADVRKEYDELRVLFGDELDKKLVTVAADDAVKPSSKSS